MAYTLGNKRPKNCCKQTILLQLIVENVVTFFLRHKGSFHFLDQFFAETFAEP